MKKITLLLILVNTLFAIPQCDQNANACAYVYKTPMRVEIKVVNMRSKTIIFSLGGRIGTQSRAVYNRKLAPYQSYSFMKKTYKYGEEHDNPSYQYKIQNYIPNKNQDLKLRYPY